MCQSFQNTQTATCIYSFVCRLHNLAYRCFFSSCSLVKLFFRKLLLQHPPRQCKVGTSRISGTIRARKFLLNDVNNMQLSII